MSRYERFGTRDLVFSNWHRYALGDAEKQINIDTLEYCQRCRETLALIEDARDVGQKRKPTLVMEKLARRLPGVGAFCVLYTHSAEPCRCDGPNRWPGCEHGISSFRVRRVWPNPTEFVGWSPAGLANWIAKLHLNHERRECQMRVVA